MIEPGFLGYSIFPDKAIWVRCLVLGHMGRFCWWLLEAQVVARATDGTWILCRETKSQNWVVCSEVQVKTSTKTMKKYEKTMPDHLQPLLESHLITFDRLLAQHRGTSSQSWGLLPLVATLRAGLKISPWLNSWESLKATSSERLVGAYCCLNCRKERNQTLSLLHGSFFQARCWTPSQRMWCPGA